MIKRKLLIKLWQRHYYQIQTVLTAGKPNKVIGKEIAKYWSRITQKLKYSSFFVTVEMI